jgi:hypothetical protein
MAAPSGDTLDKDKAVPFVVNFQMVDADNNGSISQDEFDMKGTLGGVANLGFRH